jgi:hypothetical protein
LAKLIDCVITWPSWLTMLLCIHTGQEEQESPYTYKRALVDTREMPTRSDIPFWKGSGVGGFWASSTREKECHSFSHSFIP